MKKVLLLVLTLTSLAFSSPSLAQQNVTAGELERQNEAFLEQAGLGTKSLSVAIANVIKILLSFLGVIFIILIIYAGFMWMTSAGNEDKIKKAKSTMAAAIIGLAIVLAAYAITYFVIDQLIEATKGGQGLD